MNNNQFVLRFNNNLIISFSRHFHFIPDRILASFPGESTIILIYKQLYTRPCDVNFWDLIEKMKGLLFGICLGFESRYFFFWSWIHESRHVSKDSKQAIFFFFFSKVGSAFILEKKKEKKRKEKKIGQGPNSIWKLIYDPPQRRKDYSL